MIERFTEEELRQIKKELALLEKTPRKDAVCDLSERLWKLQNRNKWTRLDKFNREKFITAIYFVIDETLGNMKLREIRRGGPDRKNRESVSIQNTNSVCVDIDEYQQMYEEIMATIEKHFKWDNQIKEVL